MQNYSVVLKKILPALTCSYITERWCQIENGSLQTKCLTSLCTSGRPLCFPLSALPTITLFSVQYSGLKLRSCAVKWKKRAQAVTEALIWLAKVMTALKLYQHAVMAWKGLAGWLLTCVVVTYAIARSYLCLLPSCLPFAVQRQG